MAPRPVGELQQLLNNLVDLLLVHQVETFFNREQHPIVGRGWRLLTAVIMAQGRPRSRVALRRVPYSRVSQRTSVQARLEPDDQHPKQRAYARAYQAAPEAEPTTARWLAARCIVIGSLIGVRGRMRGWGDVCRLGPLSLE
jgi:hypothetical protein